MMIHPQIHMVIHALAGMIHMKLKDPMVALVDMMMMILVLQNNVVLAVVVLLVMEET